MIIFNEDILFVHNPKSAGTSIISFMQSTLPRTFSAGVEQLGTWHPSLSLALRYACGITERSGFRRVISVIRNPFDREVSMYIYYRNTLQRSPSLARDLPDAAMQRCVQKASELEFRSYIKWLWDNHGTVDIWRSRCFCETDEGIVPDSLRVLKFENLNSDLADALGLPSVELPNLNKSMRRPTDAYYDADTIDLVKRSYEWMFEAGHYAEVVVPSVRINVSHSATAGLDLS
jgi:hypothetical protein